MLKISRDSFCFHSDNQNVGVAAPFAYTKKTHKVMYCIAFLKTPIQEVRKMFSEGLRLYISDGKDRCRGGVENIRCTLSPFVALAKKPNVFCSVTAGAAEQVERDVQVGRSHRFQEVFRICTQGLSFIAAFISSFEQPDCRRGGFFFFFLYSSRVMIK